MTIRKVILALRGFNGTNSFEDKLVFWNSFINLQKNLPSNIQVKFILQNYKGKESKLNSFLFEPFVEFNLNTDNISFDLKEYKKNFSKRIRINQINYSLKESYFVSSISDYLVNNKNKYSILGNDSSSESDRSEYDEGNTNWIKVTKKHKQTKEDIG